MQSPLRAKAIKTDSEAFVCVFSLHKRKEYLKTAAHRHTPVIPITSLLRPVWSNAQKVAVIVTL